MSLSYRSREAHGEPEGALVLFHGRGADEHDLFPLLDLLDPERRLAGFTPRAPLSLPPGGAHWYIVREVGYPDPSTFLPTIELASEWLDGLDFPPERTLLGGFSQGAVMAYSLGLAAERPRPAGILALSGFLPVVNGFELDLAREPRPPVAIAHGAYDPVISVEFARHARWQLEDAGLAVTYRESPIAHAIDPHVIAEFVPWLASAVSPASRPPTQPREPRTKTA